MKQEYTNPTFYVADIQKITHLSPEPAICIWFSGCSVRCEGCINKHLWEKESGTAYTMEELYEVVKGKVKEDSSITTVIFSGGEPLDQGFENIERLSSCIRFPGIGIENIIIFTGREDLSLSLLRDICSSVTTVLIGKYKSSPNGISEKIILSDKKEHLEFYRNLEKQQVVEVIIKEDTTKVTGFKELDKGVKKYKVTWDESVIQSWYAMVEASSKEEAMEIVRNWDADRFSPELEDEDCKECLIDLGIEGEEEDENEGENEL